MRKEKILITGANGQIGSVLTAQLRENYGHSNVLATDIRMPKKDTGPFELLDVMDAQKWAKLIDQYEITQVYHLVAILSASGEKMPKKTWDINVGSLLSLLDIAQEKKLNKIFFPSSIAVF